VLSSSARLWPPGCGCGAQEDDDAEGGHPDSPAGLPPAGHRIRPRAARAAGKTVTFADGSAAEFDAVVWATGFTADHEWIDIPEAKDDQGRILHQRGVTPSPGLYMLGRTWQHTPAAPRCSAG